ncbi:OprD family outer membrane porin [Fulvivirga sedimenti]|uniref:OprD family outer membrane porin n=1 Tax=Fulvivirga sedimenti TaxID=2879465 RepID=A0A9X1HYC7_9BACT|nr:OprD family outer membrane porin [Fulvivirga sedimenti]MCA6078802.1 OprD family outer membrane porin [Fulvivirga sedimenti]
MALRKISNLLILLALPVMLSAQSVRPAKDSVRSYGVLSGEWRTFYMATVNKDSLKDFQALATGGYIRYAYHIRDRFEIAGGLYTSFNLNIQDLEVPDPATGRPSRYESGLFDVNDLGDRSVFIIGELYGVYSWKNGHIKAGRMKTKTPFVNGQDGRMIPTFVQGAYFYHKPVPQLDYTIGIYNEIGPRSTGKFFGIGESIGQYPAGRNPDGSPSRYKDNTQSDFMIMSDVNWRPATNFRVRLVDYHIDNTFHSFYLNPAFTWKIKDRTFTAQAEWVHEDRVGNGGNENPDLQYFTDKSANVLGFELSTRKKTSWRIAYNRITDNGRFLFPREWGREFLFAFQKRERSEGLRDAHALLIAVRHDLSLKKDILTSEFSIGRHWNPDVTNAAANKYAMPDYTHFNLDLSYRSEKVKNLYPELLITYKAARSNVPENPAIYLNKVDMWHFSLVLNYRFKK